MKVLVAGGNGLLGSEIVQALSDAGHEVGILGRSRPRQPGLQWVRADVTRPSSLESKMLTWDVVIDAVQFPNSPMENPKKGYTFENIDLGGTINLSNAARREGVGHYIDISGVGASPNSEHHWNRFKWQAEQHLQDSGLPYTILRPSWAFGPNDVSLNRFLGFAKFLPFIPVIGSGQTRINPVYVKDIGAHIAAMVARGPSNEIFEIGGPAVMTMDEVIREALAVMEKRRFLLHQPVWLMKAVAMVAQFLPGRPLTPGGIDFVVQDGVADTTRLQAVFGLRLTPFDEAVRDYL